MNKIEKSHNSVGLTKSEFLTIWQLIGSCRVYLESW